MKLTFLGAAETVTGSKYLVETNKKKILIDCGLFQGLKQLRLLNWESLPIDPASINAVLLTHGHLDHVGYLPRLVKLGFKGKIYGTRPTLQIANIILKDTAEIQEEEAKRANREGYSKHKPAKPLYDLKDAKNAIRLFESVEEGEPFSFDKGFKATFLSNGHILGATFICLETKGKAIVFSGDIGRKEDFLMYPPKKPDRADVLLIETTYGGRDHLDEASVVPQIKKIVNETVKKRGSLFIPSFAVERAQLLMFILWKLAKEKQIPKIPMILDSPMGADVLRLFKDASSWHKLSEEEAQEMCGYFHVVKSFKETLKLREEMTPKIVIAGSGMLSGGRILNYLEERGGYENDTLLLAGFQGEGTRGRDLLHGAKELKIYGRFVPFKMRLEQLEGLSAHADQEGLLDWLSDLKEAPEKIYLVHGELSQSKAFQEALLAKKGWPSDIPVLGETVEL